MSRPSVGWYPLVCILIPMEGPKGFDKSSNSTGVSTAVVCIIALLSSLGMMCGSAKVQLWAQVKSGRFSSDTWIGVGVAVVGIDVEVSSVDP